MNFASLVTRGIIYTQNRIYGGLLRNHSPLGHASLDTADIDEANRHIAELLSARGPCMISRFGCTEKDAFERWIDESASYSKPVKILRMAAGLQGPFWYDDSVRNNMSRISGFFPTDNKSLRAFGRQVEQDCRLIDLYATWYPGDRRIKRRFFPNAYTVHLEHLEPFFSSCPWIQSLAGRKVLVVLPFAESVRRQYAHKEDLFPTPDFLPDFELLTYAPVVSHANEKTRFATWFEALDHMLNEIASLNFEIAIIGAGAYGMSLAAGIKRMGRKGFHLGGATQLLFGIRGRRWDSFERYLPLFRPSWCRPLPSETPSHKALVEGGSYW